ncbi:MAG: FG-GAP repeat domain-containing protein [Bryobacteraceae bacterium]
MCRFAVLAVVLAAPLLAQTLRFQKTTETIIGHGFLKPAGLAAGDLDGDGAPDLAVADATGALAVTFSDGAGGFGRGARYPLGEGVQSVVLADFDRDGNLDIAASVARPHMIAVFRGTGGGAFGEPLRLALPGAGLGLAAADLNGDGLPDIAAAQERSVAVFLNAGDGSFKDPAWFPVTGDAMKILAADVNRDGMPDLVVETRLSASLSVLLGRDDGRFEDEKILRLHEYLRPHDLAVGDFNEDGLPDLVVCGQNGYMLLSGNGDGFFNLGEFIRQEATPLAAAAADLDGDGHLDLLLGNYYGGDTTVLLGDGQAGFYSAMPLRARGDTSQIVIADLNGDGIPDCAAANYSGFAVMVALGAGGGTFRVPAFLGGWPGDLAAADFDGDGRADIAAGNLSAGRVEIIRGGGEPSAAEAVGFGPVRLLGGDFNRDGHRDLVAVGENLRQVALLLGDGRGGFQTSAGEIGLPPSTLPFSITAGDFNGDGFTELASVEAPYNIPCTINVHSWTGARFDPAFKLEGLPGCWLFAAADMDGDQVPEIVAAAQPEFGNPGSLTVHKGPRGGPFRQSARYELAEPVQAIWVADFTGDGKPDIAASGWRFLSVFSGAITVTSRFADEINFGPALADYDGDGKVDLLLKNYGALGPCVLAGNGDGTFRAPHPLLNGILARAGGAVEPGDFDGDGKTDIAVAPYGAASVLVLRNER